jgi:hypothetical protein
MSLIMMAVFADYYCCAAGDFSRKSLESNMKHQSIDNGGVSKPGHSKSPQCSLDVAAVLSVPCVLFCSKSSTWRKEKARG